MEKNLTGKKPNFRSNAAKVNSYRLLALLILVLVGVFMLRALGDIAWTSPEPAFRRALYDEGKRIVEGCAEKLGEEELRPMRVRLSALEKLVTVPAAADISGMRP